MSRLFEWQYLICVLSLLLGGVMVLGSALGVVGAEAELETEHELGDHGGTAGSLLDALGLGRAPLSVFVTTFLFAFGGAGLCLSLLLGPWLALGTAALLGLASARAVSRAFARFVPSVESYATEKEDVIGATGVAEMRIAGDFGIARVSDRTGTPIRIKCRAYAAPIAKGSEILVVDYDHDSAVYTVDSHSTELNTRRSES